MNVLWLITSLIPAPFLFHFYEYGQHVKREEASFLFLGSLFFVVMVGVLATRKKVRYVILVNVVTGVVSIFLAVNFIPDDGYWFTPLNRDYAVMLLTLVFLLGQLFVRWAARLYIKGEH